jgi:pyridoxal phosphate enzyme (YggS family)
MAELIHGLDPDRVRANLERVREDIAAAAARAGREPSDVELCAAVKYVPVEETGALVEAGITLAGENRQQDLSARAERFGDGLALDFIGHLQSRKVKLVLPQARLIHSVASDSVLAQLERHGTGDTEVLVEVNLSGEENKSGVAPEDLDAFLERCPVRVGGLMTMPPLADDPETSRPWFARLRDLAAERGLARLSMGTSQDYAVAVEEGATIVRVGTMLYR